MSAPIDRLRRLAAALGAGEVPDAGDAAWFVAAIAHYLDDAPAGCSMDDALQLKPATGQAAWWRVEARERRNAAIRELHRTSFSTFGIPRAASEIARLFHCAQRGGRLQDLRASELVAEALSAGAAVPGPKRIQSILEISPGS
jgi:hypothetical protein